jgi:HAE1 family hydrophobic/amphiphilic exporter-1
MGEIYKSPLRVYLVLALLALWGVLSGLSLPISLFPNSSKPTIHAQVNYGNLAPDEFSKTYGGIIESQLKGLLVDGKTVENLTTYYRAKEVEFTIEFQWGTPGERALREVQTLMAALSAAWPEESRRNYSVNYWSENSGFLALSFYSPLRSLDDLYEDLKPLMDPISSRVPDASGVGLYNPNQKHVEIVTNPERLASLNLLPSDIESAILNANNSLSGGRLQVGENKISIQFPRDLASIEDLRNLSIYTRGGILLRLKDIADVHLVQQTKSMQSFKTSGVPSLILFANPKPGGNIKKMADDIMAEVEKIRPQIPKDVEYRVLVNPSEFINSSIHSVLHEVGLAAGLAVLILLLFIGSFKNVATAAVEIPMSIVLAFIFMKFFNMNLNLISLGGLALSAGMNVDASVVVMENIFRHFEHAPPRLSQNERLEIVLKAVREVWMPVLASTIASLVVFIPLILTSGLTNSILGDLAKAVVFSHSMSAVVALILVPTIRLQMMKSETSFHLQSPIEKQFRWLENQYATWLNRLIHAPKAKAVFYSTITVSLTALVIFVLPKLPKEIIGRPETDWVILGINAPTFTESRQLDSFTEKLEFDLLKKYENDVSYTFTQLNGTRNGFVMMRLNDRKDMDRLWKQLEEEYVNSPTISYWVEPWNPSELPIPNPPNLRWEVRGGSPEERMKVSEDIRVLLSEAQVFPHVRTQPDSSKDEQVVMRPRVDVLARMERPQAVNLSDLSQYVRVATEGKYIGDLSVGMKVYAMDLAITPNRVKAVEDLKGLPVGLGGKVIPLGALAGISVEKEPPGLYRYNDAEMTIVSARANESEKSEVPQKQAQAKSILADWRAKNPSAKVSVLETEPDIEVQEALRQLKWALALSVLLIFMTMVLQFGDLVHALLVLVAIPLGMIGVLISLFVFKSTLSLNSVLGMILLNGIAVANSIILVDFMKKLVDEGLSPNEAAVEASKARLRPILMTSLTTVLGMIPIALGFGEGGRILQPLGISVAGGLWISMLLTLFAVPSLQASYLNWKRRKSAVPLSWTETGKELQ